MIAPRQFEITGECLVTGATGLVGNNIVRQLLARGVGVRVLIRSDSPVGSKALAGLAVDAVEGNVSDEDSLARAMKGVSAVVHAAAYVHCGWRNGEAMREVNVEGTRNVARAARQVGARLVHVSSTDTVGIRHDGIPGDEETPPGGMPQFPYVVTKLEAERVVADEVDRGLDAVIVNPAYMLGPWDWKPSSGRMLLEIGAGKGLFAPPGSNDFVDVRDVAAGIFAALVKGKTGSRYILGGHALSYLAAWRVMAQAAGRMQPLGLAPRPCVRLAGLIGDLKAAVSGREGPMNSAATRTSLLAHNYSCRRAVDELGYSFRPFEDTVQDAWDWFVARGYAKAAAPALAR